MARYPEGVYDDCVACVAGCGDVDVEFLLLNARRAIQLADCLVSRPSGSGTSSRSRSQVCLPDSSLFHPESRMSCS